VRNQPCRNASFPFFLLLFPLQALQKRIEDAFLSSPFPSPFFLLLHRPACRPKLHPHQLDRVLDAFRPGISSSRFSFPPLFFPSNGHRRKQNDIADLRCWRPPFMRFLLPLLLSRPPNMLRMMIVRMLAAVLFVPFRADPAGARR